MSFSRRRVVTRLDEAGLGRFASDGMPPNSVASPEGFGVTEVLWLDGPAADVDAGGDRRGSGYPLEPPSGGLSSRIISMPPSPDWLRIDGDDPDHPGMHATDTLDLMMVLAGEITLGLPGGDHRVGAGDGVELRLGAGDVVVQQGTAHRWRVSGDTPCIYWVTMLRPDRAPAAPTPLEIRPGDGPVRRIVTGVSPVLDANAPAGIDTPNVVISDLWQTGGPLVTPRQGGDPSGEWNLLPIGGGVGFRMVEMAPGPPSEAGWHATDTIDIDVVARGRVRLELDGDDPVELGPGDCVVQRGTNHRWTAVGDEPFAMGTVMVGLR